MMPWLPQTLKFQNCLEGPPGWFSWQSGEHPSACCSDPWARTWWRLCPSSGNLGSFPHCPCLTVYSDCSLFSSSFRVSKGRLALLVPQEW